MQRAFKKAIKEAKELHWRDFLEGADEQTIWTAHKYATEEYSGNASTRIPTLKIKNTAGQVVRQEETNQGKAALLAETFFKPAPPIPPTSLISHTQNPSQTLPRSKAAKSYTPSPKCTLTRHPESTTMPTSSTKTVPPSSNLG